VEPIDALARAEDAFLDVVCLRPRDGEAAWPHCRVLLFRDTAQLEAFTGRLAAAAEAFDGGMQQTARRKAYADGLRAVVGSEDLAVTSAG